MSKNERKHKTNKIQKNHDLFASLILLLTQNQFNPVNLFNPLSPVNPFHYDKSVNPLTLLPH